MQRGGPLPLKFFPAREIRSAFNDGRLRPDDILLTDGVPADTPVLAGIISLTPATPNSHTAILSRAFGRPFVFISRATDQERARRLVGQKIILRATTRFSGHLVKVLEFEEGIPAALETNLLALKQTPSIRFEPKRVSGAISESTDNLRPSDQCCFGGKAAHYGLLRQSIPDHWPARDRLLLRLVGCLFGPVTSQ